MSDTQLVSGRHGLVSFPEESCSCSALGPTPTLAHPLLSLPLAPVMVNSKGRRPGRSHPRQEMGRLCGNALGEWPDEAPLPDPTVNSGGWGHSSHPPCLANSSPPFKTQPKIPHLGSSSRNLHLGKLTYRILSELPQSSVCP